MRIIARSGSSYIVISDDTDPSDLRAKGQVLDELKRLWPPFYVDSILARGYWDHYDPDSDEVSRIMEDAIEIPAGDREEIANASREAARIGMERLEAKSRVEQSSTA